MRNWGPEEVVPGAGDIGLVQIGGHVGRAIRVGQWLNGTGFANYEHAFIMLDSETLVEAEPDGARLAFLRVEYGTDIVWLRCPDEFRESVQSAAMSLIGTPYSFADYVALAAHRLHIPAPHLRQYIKDSGHMICSQLVDHAALLGGWHLFDDGRWEGDVTPGDLYGLAAKVVTAR